MTIPTTRSEAELLAGAGLACPNGCADGWTLYEECTASRCVFLGGDGTVSVGVPEVNFFGSETAWFECDRCGHTVFANEVDCSRAL